MNKEIKNIIEDIFRSGDLNRVVYKFSLSSYSEINDELKKDFIQELILILADYKKPEVIIEMFNRNRNELLRFMIAITHRQINSQTSPFWKKYKRYLYNRIPFENYSNYEKDIVGYNE